MNISKKEYGTAVHRHVHAFFNGHDSRRRYFDRGPIQETVSGFHVIEIEPGALVDYWVYVSVGCGTICLPGAGRFEFLITSPVQDERCVERLAMTTYYHSTRTLGIGHTFPLGEPWVQGSALDHAVISLPYPFGEKLEILNCGGEHVHLAWLLPITAAEREHKERVGLESLEQAFDDAELNYLDLQRDSVV